MGIKSIDFHGTIPTNLWQISPLVMPENGPFIDDLPIRNCDFPVRYVNVYQRVYAMVTPAEDWQYYVAKNWQ